MLPRLHSRPIKISWPIRMRFWGINLDSLEYQLNDHKNVEWHWFRDGVTCKRDLMNSQHQLLFHQWPKIVARDWLQSLYPFESFYKLPRDVNVLLGLEDSNDFQKLTSSTYPSKDIECWRYRPSYPSSNSGCGPDPLRSELFIQFYDETVMQTTLENFVWATAR